MGVHGFIKVLFVATDSGKLGDLGVTYKYTKGKPGVPQLLCELFYDCEEFPIWDVSW